MFRVRATAAVTLALTLALAACTSSSDEDDEPEFEGTLSVGLLLPGDGDPAGLSPALVAAVEVAQEEINEAGGVWGSDVVVETYDETDPPADVHAVIGPVATERTLEVIEPLRDAGVLQVSPASPGIVLDDHPARDYFFRIRPSDVIQAAALVQALTDAGHQRVAIVARDDAYGAGLAEAVQTRFVEAAEEHEVVADVRYQDAPDVDEVVGELAAAEPEAVVVVSYAEGAELLAGLADADLAPAAEPAEPAEPAEGEDGDAAAGTAWYLVSGNLLDYSEELPEGTLAGVTGFAPAPAPEREDLWDSMDAHTPGLANHAFGAEAYDALVMLALGAVAANTDDPDAIRTAMLDISRDPGNPCGPAAQGTYQDCVDLLAEGEDINYYGESGPVSWNDTGDAQIGSVGVYEYAEDNTFSRVRVDDLQL